MSHKLVDFDWTVHEIVSSSMCDDHSVFKNQQDASNVANSNSNSNNNASSSSTTGGAATTDEQQQEESAITKSLRDPLSHVLRLELLLKQQKRNKNNNNNDSGSTAAKPHLFELSKREVDMLIREIQRVVQ